MHSVCWPLLVPRTLDINNNNWISYQNPPHREELNARICHEFVITVYVTDQFFLVKQASLFPRFVQASGTGITSADKSLGWLSGLSGTCCHCYNGTAVGIAMPIGCSR